MKRNVLPSVYRRVYAATNYRLRTIARGRVASHCRPTSIALLMTERCNARCIHCDIWKNHGQEDRPTGEQWKTVLSDLRSWLGPVHVVLTGGEAMLNRDTLDLVRYGSSLGLFIELLSHGFWEDQTKIEELALARPSRITISFDGVGETHNLIRGRDDFARKTYRTIQTLKRMRSEHDLDLAIRLKTVIMRQNLDDLANVARFAKENGLELFYQPIEQNYNTTEDPNWFEHSETWPDDPEAAIAAVRELCELKRRGLPIANTVEQLDAMVPYFLEPRGSRVAVRLHSAHEGGRTCVATITLQIQANGDVRPCSFKGAIGNIKSESIRKIWQARPKWWQQGCCIQERLNSVT